MSRRSWIARYTAAISGSEKRFKVESVIHPCLKKCLRGNDQANNPPNNQAKEEATHAGVDRRELKFPQPTSAAAWSRTTNAHRCRYTPHPRRLPINLRIARCRYLINRRLIPVVPFTVRPRYPEDTDLLRRVLLRRSGD